MNENAKTLTFVGIAAVLLVGAWMLRPAPIDNDVQDDIGTKFFPDFDEPLAATAMEIVDVDKETGEPHTFRVAQINDVWSIPSHEGYPADAKNQLEMAAASVIDLEKLAKVSDDPAEHALYGVIDPDVKSEDLETEGVGKRVTLEDKSGKKLAQFIIGKQVPDSTSLYFVRVPGQDRVYQVSVNTDKLTTKFQSWIEEDLLKLQAFDIKQVTMDDHSVDELRGAIIMRGVTTVDYDNKDAKWTLEDMKTFNPTTRKWEELKLADDEELDTQKLNDLKTALDDLKIVDVARKPQGLNADLRGGGAEAIKADMAEALARKGFFLIQRDPNSDATEIVSSEGEVRCGTADGVEYVLRFGNLAGKSSDDEDDKEKPADADKAADADKPGKKGDDAKTKGVDRYIMVTTRFREDLIPKPDLPALPELPEGATDDAAAEKPAGADAPKADADKPDAAKPEPKKDGAAIQSGPQAILTAYQPPAKKAGTAAPKAAGKAPATKAPEAKPAEPKADADKPTTEAKPDADKPAADKADEEPAAPVDPDAAAKAADQAKREIIAQRKQIQAERDRLQGEYDRKVETGEKRVKELNERFAAWYYEISDSTYQKIHISREELVRKKSDKPETDAAPGGPGQGQLPPGFDPRAFQHP